MARVYEAEQQNPRRIVALKLIHSAWVSPRRARRFEDEIEILGRFRHQNVARIYDSGQVDSQAGSIRYFVMERIEGSQLREWALEKNPSTEELLRVVIGACRGVAEAHRHGVIHRDLKPQNILVDAGGTAKVLDFGIARARGDEISFTDTRTREGELLGTLQYMSPEQLEGDPEVLDTRTDVYSMGAVLFELLSGTLPHDVESSAGPGRVGRLKLTAPRRLSKCVPSFAGDLDSIVGKALEPALGDRYSSIEALAQDLEAFLDRRPICARPPSVWRQLRLFAARQKRTFVALLLSATALIAALVLVLRFAVQAEEARSEAVSAREASRLEAYRARIAAAAAALEAGDSASARRTLAGTDEDCRSWEWSYLQAAADQSAQTFEGNKSPVWDATLSNDLKRLYTVGGAVFASPYEQAVRAFDAETGDVLWSHVDLPDQQLRLALFEKRGLLVTGGGDKDPSLRVWNSESGELLQVITRHKLRIEDLISTGDMNRLISSSADGTIDLWSFNASDQLSHERRIASDLGAVTDIALALDTVFVAANRARVSALRISDGEVLWSLERNASELAVAPGGACLALGMTDGRVEVFDLLKMDPERSIWFDQTHSVTALAFSADARFLYGGSRGQKLYVWNLETKRLQTLLQGHTGEIQHVSLAAEGQLLLTSGNDCTAKLWDLDQRTTAESPRVTSVRGVDSDAGGELYAFVVFEGELHVRRAADDSLLHEWPVASSRVHAVAIDEELGYVVCDEGLDLRVHSLHNDESFVLQGHAQPILALDFDPNRSRLASASVDGTVRIWDLPTRSEIARLPHGGPGSGSAPWTLDKRLWTVRWSPDGSLLASASASGRITLWALDHATHQFTPQDDLPGSGDSVSTVAWSPDGSRLAVGGDARRLRVFDTQTGEFFDVASAHSDPIVGVTYTRDGQRILTTSWDETVRIYDARNGAEVVTLHPLDSIATALALGPDEETLLLGHRRGLRVMRTMARDSER